jgi:hypothetical protein
MYCIEVETRDSTLPAKAVQKQAYDGLVVVFKEREY